MEISPFIAALRRDRTPQRQAQAAMEQARRAWRAEDGACDVMDDLARYGAGAPLEACPALEAVFMQPGEAERLMQCLSRHYCAALHAAPIGHPPFRNGFDGAVSSILLGRSGRAQLMVQAREPGEASPPSYIFSDSIRHDAVLAGSARARMVRTLESSGPSRRFDCEALTLSGGTRFSQDLSRETLVIDRVERRLVMLRLVRHAAEPEPTREFDARTGELLQQSAGQISTSRQEAMIALLGRMERTEAAPYMARIALAESDASLRWQALRECIALDSAEGFRALCKVARQGDDPLSAHAGALRAQLLETYPELAQLETGPCPA